MNKQFRNNCQENQICEFETQVYESEEAYNQNFEIIEAVVLFIQKNFRGYQTRKLLSEYKAHLESLKRNFIRQITNSRQKNETCAMKRSTYINKRSIEEAAVKQSQFHSLRKPAEARKSILIDFDIDNLLHEIRKIS